MAADQDRNHRLWGQGFGKRRPHAGLKAVDRLGVQRSGDSLLASKVVIEAAHAGWGRGAYVFDRGRFIARS